jgi:hypothetical protein
MIKTYLLPLLGILLISFVHGKTQESDGGGKPISDIRYPTMNEAQFRALVEKASTDAKEFSEDEVREMLYRVCLAQCPLDEYYQILRRKLIDIDESIFPLLSEEALKPHEGVWGMESGGGIAAGIVSFFDTSEGDKTEARKTTLKVFEKFPKEYIAICRVMGNIGEPEDVTKLLSFMNAKDADAYVFREVLQAVGKISAVSQIPEIEKAVAEWDKKHPTDSEDWEMRRKAEIDKHLTNIRERNVQWTPPPKAEEPKAENKEPASEAGKKP